MKKQMQLSLFKKDLRFHGGQLLLGKRKTLSPLSTKDPIHLVLRSSWAVGRWSFLRPQNKTAIALMIQILSRKYGIRIYRTAIQSNHLHLVLKIESRRTYKAFIRTLSGKIAMHVMKRVSFETFQKTLGVHRAPSKADRAPGLRGDGQKTLASDQAPSRSNVRTQVSGDGQKPLAWDQGSPLPDDGQPQAPGDALEPQGKGQKFWQFRPFTRVLSWGKDFKQCCAYVLQNILEAAGFASYEPRKNHYARWLSDYHALQLDT